MSPSSTIRRPVRIGGASGGFSDRVFAITQLAKNPEVDVIMGDWLSEMTMTIHGAGKINNQKKASAGKSVRDGVTGTGHHAGMYFRNTSISSVHRTFMLNLTYPKFMSISVASTTVSV